MVACPAPEQLRAFASGLLSDELSAALGNHLEQCTSCQGTLAGLGQRELPSTHLGRYRLQRTLGAGGMGVVYRAWDPQLARAVAIKVVKHAGTDEASRARLVREAQSLARLSHPNVCHVYDVGTHEDEVWVAMELIDGGSLRAWAGKHSHDQVLRALLAAAEGIHAAHTAGLVHRDVKPENVLVATNGRAVVTDFGLARTDNNSVDGLASTAVSGSDPRATVESAMTASGVVAGTPAYLAPEQLTGAPLDARVDQFAWAVMAWELLTGMLPFPIVHAARLEAIRAGISPPASMSRPLAAVLQRALAVAPRDRFPSMRELIDAIPTTAAKRSRALPVALAGALVIVGGGVAVWRLQAGDEANPTPPPVAAPIATAPVDSASIAPSTPDAALQAALADAGEVVAVAPDATASVPPEPVRPTPPRPTPTRPVPTGSLPAIDETAPLATTTPLPPQPVEDSDAAWALGADKIKKNRSIAESMMATYCTLSTDPARSKDDFVIDWGPLVRREIVSIPMGDDPPRHLGMYEVKGQRATYRFDSATTYMYLPATVGQLVAVCRDDVGPPPTRLPAAWAGAVPMKAYITLSRPPRIMSYAKLAPIYMKDTTIGNQAGTHGKQPFESGKHYIVRARPESAKDGRWTVESDWDIAVAQNAPGAHLVTEGKSLWFLFDRGDFVGPEGKQRFVAHAIAVITDMFPP